MGTWLSMLLAENNQANFCYNQGDILGALASQAFVAEMTGAKLHIPLYIQSSAYIETEDRIKLETAFNKNKILIGKEIRKYVDAYNAQNQNFFKAGKNANSPLEADDFKVTPAEATSQYLPEGSKQ